MGNTNINEPKIRMKQIHVLPTWLPYKAISLFGFIFVKKNRQLTQRSLRHEAIHFEQQKELAYLFFFAWYLIEFIVRFLTLWNWNKAYRCISFEQEAYRYDDKPFYLQNRKGMAWFPYASRDLTRFVNRRWFVILLAGFGLGWAWMNTSLPLYIYDAVEPTPVQAEREKIFEGVNHLTHEQPNIDIQVFQVEDIYNAWKQNKVRFSERYEGKYARIQGRVHTIDNRLLEGAILSLSKDTYGPRVYVLFGEEHLDAIADLNVGQIITVGGVVSSAMSAAPTLKEAEIAD